MQPAPTNQGTGLDKSELQLCDIKTGEVTRVERDPEDAVDFGDALFSEVSDELLATFYSGDRQRVYPKQKQFGEDWDKNGEGSSEW